MDADDPRHTRTARLELDAVTPGDVPELLPRRGDPPVWWDFPPVPTADDDELADLVGRLAGQWDRDGLGFWVVRAAGSRVLLGVGGCGQVRAPAWSLYYRLRTSALGQGFAEEVVGAAVSWAARVDPALPVVARLLESNVRARRVVEGVGLSAVWSQVAGGSGAADGSLGAAGAGSAAGADATSLLVYADRPLEPAVLEALTAPSPPR